MKPYHNPVIDLRYWTLISLVSVFGTNTGDLAVRLFRQFSEATHWSMGGFRHMGPLPVLVVAYILNLFLEDRSEGKTELYFWTAIILIRTAATNIADSLMDDVGLSFILLAGGLSVVMAGLAWYWQSQRPQPINPMFVPESNRLYWSCMLTAGVLGTVIGDEVWHGFGLPLASSVLSVAMIALIATGYRRFLKMTAWYWFGVVFARIAGTAVGDWLAKSHERGGAGFDIYQATMLSGLLFFTVLMVWKRPALAE